MSNLPFLDGEPSEAVIESAPVVEQSAPAPEPQAAAPAASEPVAPAQPRASDGKFAPKGDAVPVQAAPESQPAPVAAVAPTVAPAPTEPGHVPISALLDEREKRQAYEKRIAEFEARDAKAKAEAEAVKAPEFNDDPLAHLDARDADFQVRLYVQNREFSRRWAVKEYGKETVEKVGEWARARAEADPQFNQQALNSDDPYEFAMQAWKRDQVVSQVSADDLDDYLAWKAAKVGQTADAPIAAVPAALPQSAPRPPPPSLASQPSAGGPAHVPSGQGKAYEALFSG